MKILNTSSIAALLAGGTIALLPLDSLTEQLSGIAIAFLILSGASYLINHHKPAK
jgi:predicted membrane channel-forming protein YqfA (hemolysin III family)